MPDTPQNHRCAATIRFSHCYPKLVVALDGATPGATTTATLLDVFTIRLERLSKPFLMWDTDNGLYPLPAKGKYMMLLFMGRRGMFPTLRRWTEEKETYYRGLIGKRLAVEIAADPNQEKDCAHRTAVDIQEDNHYALYMYCPECKQKITRAEHIAKECEFSRARPEV